MKSGEEDLDEEDEEIVYEVLASVGSTVTLKCETVHTVYDTVTWLRNDSKRVVAKKESNYEHVSKLHQSKLHQSYYLSGSKPITARFCASLIFKPQK